MRCITYVRPNGRCVRSQPLDLQEVELPSTLEIGMRGQPVRRVQEWLSLRGCPLVIDGIYGIATTETVARFQQDASLVPDGQVTPETFALLVEPLRSALSQRLDTCERSGPPSSPMPKPTSPSTRGRSAARTAARGCGSI